MIGVLGGAFDPPHKGHVAVAHAAKEQFAFDGFIVLVSAAPGHKDVALDLDARLQLVRAAFPEEVIEVDEHARTIDTLRARRWDDPLFLVGADEFRDFLTWKDPEGVLALARLGVATRPGYPRERLDDVLAGLAHPDRVLFFEIDPLPISSRDIRARVTNGDPIDDLVPPPVARLIAENGLYRGYTEVL